MKKRFLALLLGSVLCVGLFGTAFAASNGHWDYSRPELGPQWVVDTPQPTPPTHTPSSNPGGYVPSDPTYSVSGGSGSASEGSWTSDRSQAVAGATVIITVNPNAGLRGVPTVTDRSGAAVTVTSLGGNRYSFIMPQGGVNVSVAFAPANPFVDVLAGEFYYDAVLWAVENGITAGTGDTTFSPGDTCTRAQTVTFLWRAAGSPMPISSNNPFTDVIPGEYYYHAVLWAVEQGITNGTSDTTFSPEETVTRGQTVTFLFRAAKAQSAAGVNPFVDVDADEYYADAVQWAVNRNITNGTSDTTFSPDEGCTRGQIVTFLYRAK